jgi:hypothetical protein
MRATGSRAMLLRVPVLLMVLVDAIHFVCRYRDTRHLFDTGLMLSDVNRLLVATTRCGRVGTIKVAPLAGSSLTVAETDA